MLLRAGEVDEIRACLAMWHDHQVDLGTAEEANRRLVAAPIDDGVDGAKADEPFDQRARVVRLGKQIDVADRLAAPPERPGRDDSVDAGQALECGDQAVDQLRRPMDEEPLRSALHCRDPVEDQLFCFGRQALQAAQGASLGRQPEILERLDAELLVDLANRLRTEPRDLEHLDEGRRDLRPELVVETHRASRDELRDLVADRLTDTGYLGPTARAVRGDEVDWAPPDRVGGPVVGDGLEDQLALDLEHVADVVEDPRQVAVRQVVGGRLVSRIAVVCASEGSVVIHRSDGSGPVAPAGPAGSAGVGAATTRSRPFRFAS